MENIKIILEDDFILNLTADNFCLITKNTDSCIRFEFSYLESEEEFSFKGNYVDKLLQYSKTVVVVEVKSTKIIIVVVVKKKKAIENILMYHILIQYRIVQNQCYK